MSEKLMSLLIFSMASVHAVLGKMFAIFATMQKA